MAGLGSGTLVRDSSNKINSNLSLTSGQFFTALWLAYSSCWLKWHTSKDRETAEGDRRDSRREAGLSCACMAPRPSNYRDFHETQARRLKLVQTSGSVDFLLWGLGRAKHINDSFPLQKELCCGRGMIRDWTTWREHKVPCCYLPIFRDLDNIVSEPTSLLIYRIIPSDTKGKWRLSFILFRGRITASLSPY